MNYYYNKEMGCNFYGFAKNFYRYDDLMKYLAEMLKDFKSASRKSAYDDHDIKYLEERIEEAKAIEEKTKKVV